MDIWNNDWYADTRYRLLTGNPPQYCTDPSVKDPGHIGSYFKEELLPDVFDYDNRNPKLSKIDQSSERMVLV
ncbi:MAG: hypothetical protein GY941_26540 [Planctomycetes bacterium]|nr:hypothetical protein [Planctomycetota bacterium]